MRATCLAFVYPAYRIEEANCACVCAAARFETGQAPTTKDAQAVADELFSDFVSKDVDKVELIYTKFVSLISAEPTVQTVLPLTPQVRCWDLPLLQLLPVSAAGPPAPAAC